MEMQNPYFLELLRREFNERKARDPQYSIRRFARALRIDATMLSRILRGSEILTMRTSRNILLAVSLKEEERERFIGSVLEAQRQKWLTNLTPTQH